MPVVMNKKIGETPLQCLDRLRIEQPELADLPMTYAGRLDPMAGGVLLVLVGEECRHREDFLGLEKEYVCDILWGFETDTYDILGKVTRFAKDSGKFDFKNLPELLQKIVGKHQQKFPPYSSKPVKGKPLHEWARADRLDEIEIPSKEVEIMLAELLETKHISVEEAKKTINERISLVKGDFRQEEIISIWNNSLKGIKTDLFVSKIRIVCSTGTYIRSLVNEMGKINGAGAVVFGLCRQSVGEYK